MESDDYFDIINALNQCEPGSNEEFQLYKKLVKLVESDK